MMSTTISMTKLLTIGAALALLILTIGGAVAQRMEQRAASDRLFLGDLGYGATSPLLRVADAG